MPAKPPQPSLAAALLLSALAVLTAHAHALLDKDLPRRNDRAPHSPAVGDAEVRVQGRGDQFELISTSSQNKAPPEDKVASSDLPAADKQYDYPLVRPVFAPFVTRPSSYAVPYVEILDHHRDPPFGKPPHFVTGSPMVSTVVVQDMSQTPLRPHEEVTSLVDNFQHLGPTKIPFTDVQVVTRPINGADKKKPNFTDKLEETSLEHGGSGDSDEDDDNEELLENPPNLDLSGIVEDVVRKVFQENPVLHDAAELAPQPEVGVKTWPCPPVTCCSRPSTKPARRKCSTFVNCVAGRSPGCPLRAERVPQALALTKPSNGFSNVTDPKADVRVGEPQPRFKKKKILKKKKKLLKKFLLPLLLAYKLLFLMVVPMMVNGMMMMMSSSGMAGFFFALIGASITMVRVYNGATKHPPPPPSKVVKVIKYVQTVAPPTASPAPIPAPTPAPTLAPTLPTVIHHQPYVEEHFPTFHPPHHAPTYGSYYPPPYWTRHYDRSEGKLDGGRKKRRRTDEQLGTGVLFSSGDNQLWLV